MRIVVNLKLLTIMAEKSIPENCQLSVSFRLVLSAETVMGRGFRGVRVSAGAL